MSVPHPILSQSRSHFTSIPGAPTLPLGYHREKTEKALSPPCVAGLGGRLDSRTSLPCGFPSFPSLACLDLRVGLGWVYIAERLCSPSCSQGVAARGFATFHHAGKCGWGGVARSPSALQTYPSPHQDLYPQAWWWERSTQQKGSTSQAAA